MDKPKAEVNDLVRTHALVDEDQPPPARAVEGFAAGATDYEEGPSPPVPHAQPAAVGALFTWDVARTLGAEYAAPVRDVLRMACIQLTIQVLVWLSSPSDAPFLSADFLLLLLYIMLGVLLYWLVIRRIIRIA